MELIQIVFSPTGGTEKVVDIITAEWDGAVTRIVEYIRFMLNTYSVQELEARLVRETVF